MWPRFCLWKKAAVLDVIEYSGWILLRTLYRIRSSWVWRNRSFSKGTQKDGVIVALLSAAARVLQVLQWFHYFWNSAFWSGSTGTLGNTLWENCTFLSERPEPDPTSCFVYMLPPPPLHLPPPPCPSTPHHPLPDLLTGSP